MFIITTVVIVNEFIIERESIVDKKLINQLV